MDPLIISALIGAVATIAVGIGSAVSSYQENERNINAQEEINETTMEREDNYMQRRVQDFTAAGFSPLAALEGAGNYTSTISAPQSNINYMSPLLSGFQQASNSLTSLSGQSLSYKSSYEANQERKRMNEAFEQIERDKLSQDKQRYLDELQSAEKIAESAQKNAYDIAKYQADMQDKIARLNRAHNDLNISEEQKNKLKMLEKQLNQAWEMASKERSQKERQFWFGEIFKTVRTMIVTIPGIVGGSSSSLNPIGFAMD